MQYYTMTALMHFKLQVSMMRLKTEYEGKLKKQKQS